MSGRNGVLTLQWRSNVRAHEARPQARAAELLNVGKRSDGAPELIAAVERGDVSVSAAADVARLPKPEQREIVARGTRRLLRTRKPLFSASSHIWYSDSHTGRSLARSSHAQGALTCWFMRIITAS
jgi:hypothetical protein